MFTFLSSGFNFNLIFVSRLVIALIFVAGFAESVFDTCSAVAIITPVALISRFHIVHFFRLGCFLKHRASTQIWSTAFSQVSCRVQGSACSFPNPFSGKFSLSRHAMGFDSHFATLWLSHGLCSLQMGSWGHGRR